MHNKVHLSDAEFEVMKILWCNSPPITTNAIMSQLPEETKWKASTLATILSRLSNKGFVTSRKEGKERMYYPEVDEESYLSYETKKFMKKNLKDLLADVRRRFEHANDAVNAPLLSLF